MLSPLTGLIAVLTILLIRPDLKLEEHQSDPTAPSLNPIKALTQTPTKERDHGEFKEEWLNKLTLEAIVNWKGSSHSVTETENGFFLRSTATKTFHTENKLGLKLGDITSAKSKAKELYDIIRPLMTTGTDEERAMNIIYDSGNLELARIIAVYGIEYGNLYTEVNDEMWKQSLFSPLGDDYVKSALLGTISTASQIHPEVQNCRSLSCVSTQTPDTLTCSAENQFHLETKFTHSAVVEWKKSRIKAKVKLKHNGKKIRFIPTKNDRRKSNCSLSGGKRTDSWSDPEQAALEAALLKPPDAKMSVDKRKQYFSEQQLNQIQTHSENTFLDLSQNAALLYNPQQMNSSTDGQHIECPGSSLQGKNLLFLSPAAQNCRIVSKGHFQPAFLARNKMRYDCSGMDKTCTFVGSWLENKKETLNLKLILKGIPYEHGKITVLLHNKESSFISLNDAFRTYKIDKGTGDFSFTIPDIPPGEYALTAHHELIVDGKVTQYAGCSEGFGSSRSKRHKGKHRYEQARFELNHDKPDLITVPLEYGQGAWDCLLIP